MIYVYLDIKSLFRLEIPNLFQTGILSLNYISFIFVMHHIGIIQRLYNILVLNWNMIFPGVQSLQCPELCTVRNYDFISTTFEVGTSWEVVTHFEVGTSFEGSTDFEVVPSFKVGAIFEVGTSFNYGTCFKVLPMSTLLTSIAYRKGYPFLFANILFWTILHNYVIKRG